VGIEDVDAALDSDGGGNSWRGTGEERLVEKCATGVKSEAGTRTRAGICSSSGVDGITATVRLAPRISVFALVRDANIVPSLRQRDR